MEIGKDDLFRAQHALGLKRPKVTQIPCALKDSEVFRHSIKVGSITNIDVLIQEAFSTS